MWRTFFVSWYHFFAISFSLHTYVTFFDIFFLLVCINDPFKLHTKFSTAIDICLKWVGHGHRCDVEYVRHFLPPYS